VIALPGVFVRHVARELDRDELPAPDLARASDDDREIGRRAWASRIVDEYRSVVVFGELFSLLAAVPAPLPALATVQRLIADELRHVQLCIKVVAWLGGLGALELELTGLGLPPSPLSPGARALEVVSRELIVAETESLHALRAYRDATTDPGVRAVMDTIVKDELTHARAGHELAAILGSLLPADELAALEPELRETMEQDRAHIRRIHLDGAREGPGRPFAASVRREEIEAQIASGGVARPRIMSSRPSG
jgi:hypothetical protein